MDPVAAAKQLLDLGGWGVAVAMGVGLAVGFVKGWIVPGFAYLREVTRADSATAAVSAMTEALRQLTEEVRWDVRNRLSAERRHEPR